MSSQTQPKSSGANIGFEQQLWAAADKMRGHMDPSEYKHVALGLIFLKYISDAFEEKFNELNDEPGADPEDRDEYLAENVFWVPKGARWNNIKANARSANIGKIIDEAMAEIEKENASLKGVLPKDYSRPALDKQRLGDLVDLISTISMKTQGQKDVLGRVYEYFLARFAGAEGKGGGEFYTPQSVVRLLVEMLEPYKGRIYDPCCGSGGMFVQSEKFVEEHGGRLGDISVYGQESNFTTWRLCKMNLAIRQIEGNIGPKNADTFHNDLHKDLKADYIIANPPFNISDWGGDRLRDDMRWKYGAPPAGNANYAWVQHIVHHLAPRGFAGFVLANGSMSSTTGGEGEIRQRLIEDDMVDCMVALPGQLFYSTQIPVCLWFLAKDRSNGLVKKSKLRDRRGEVLFIDARKLGFMADRTHKDFDPVKDISYIVDAYHSWRGEDVEHEVFKNGYQDIPGFCKSTPVEEIKEHGYVLTPGRYVGAEASEDDGVPFEEKMQHLTDKMAEQMVKAQDLDNEIRKQLARVGYEF
ncbi:MAG: SAM-dependent DNA methyltransferase [Alphaproteobacteria bacterium]|nr:SAM-dependent DNA methyltransferase [Alphaproteobacteria bacterium]